MPAEAERAFLAAYLKLKAREGDATVAAELAAAHQRIEAGHFATYEDVTAAVGEDGPYVVS